MTDPIELNKARSILKKQILLFLIDENTLSVSELLESVVDKCIDRFIDNKKILDIYITIDSSPFLQRKKQTEFELLYKIKPFFKQCNDNQLLRYILASKLDGEQLIVDISHSFCSELERIKF